MKKVGDVVLYAHESGTKHCAATNIHICTYLYKFTRSVDAQMKCIKNITQFRSRKL